MTVVAIRVNKDKKSRQKSMDSPLWSTLKGGNVEPAEKNWRELTVLGNKNNCATKWNIGAKMGVSWQKSRFLGDFAFFSKFSGKFSFGGPNSHKTARICNFVILLLSKLTQIVTNPVRAIGWRLWPKVTYFFSFSLCQRGPNGPVQGGVLAD